MNMKKTEKVFSLSIDHKRDDLITLNNFLGLLVMVLICLLEIII